MEVKIREMKTGDLDKIYRLNKNELGYEYSLLEMKKSWDSISENADTCVFVAEDAGVLVGYVHAGKSEFLCQNSMAHVFTLAVSSSHQKQGIGKELLNYVENWAHQTGCIGVRILSSEAQGAAHLFYKSCGYTKTKVQINFKKYF